MPLPVSEITEGIYEGSSGTRFKVVLMCPDGVNIGCVTQTAKQWQKVFKTNLANFAAWAERRVE